MHSRQYPNHCLLRKKRPWASISAIDSDLVKFGLVGLLGTLVNLAVMAAVVELFSLPHSLSSCIAAEISIVHNFLFNNYWTFASRKPQTSLLTRFIHFNALSLTALLVNVSVSLLFINSGVNYLIAQALGIASAFAINYFVNNYLIFGKAERDTGHRGQQEGLDNPA